MSLNTNTSGNRSVLPGIVKGPTAIIFAFENVEVRRTATSIPVKTGSSVPPDCGGRETSLFCGAGIMPTRTAQLHWRTTQQIVWSPHGENNHFVIHCAAFWFSREILTLTVVPPSGLDSTENVPPMRLTRSRMLTNPRP